MTSKEALNKIKHPIDGTELKGSEILECYITIIKDLEILEILKSKAYFNLVNENPKVASIQIGITTCDDRFDKIEEWLEK